MNYLNQELVSRSNQNLFNNSKNSNSLNKILNILPNPDIVLNKAGKSLSSLYELRNDPHLWSCIQSRKAGTINSEFILEISKEHEINDMIYNFLNRYKINNLISEILEAVYFGYQVFEIIWNKEKNYYMPVDISAKSIEKFAFTSEGKLLLKNYNVFGSNSDFANQELPDYKFIAVRHQASFSNPYGTALLSKCYWSVTFKNAALRYWVNFMEKYGMPLLIGKYNRGCTQDETQQLADTLANMSEDTVIVSPSDIDISFHEARRTSSVELYSKMIEHANSEISKAILSQTLSTEVKGASLAASKSHLEVREDVLQSDRKLVESSINEIIEMIFDLNKIDKVYMPIFKFSKLSKDSLTRSEQ